MINTNKSSSMNGLATWLISIRKKGLGPLLEREMLLNQTWETIKGQYELKGTSLDLNLVDLIQQLISPNFNTNNHFIGETSMAGRFNNMNMQKNKQFTSRLQTKWQKEGVIQENDLTQFVERNQGELLTTIANHITIKKGRNTNNFSIGTDSGISKDLGNTLVGMWKEKYGKQDLTVQVIPSISSSGAEGGNIDHTIQILLSYSSSGGFRSSVPLLSVPLQQKTSNIDEPILSVMGKVDKVELNSSDALLKGIAKYFKRKDNIQFFVINNKVYSARQTWELLMDTLIDLAKSGDIDRLIRAFTKGKR